MRWTRTYGRCVLPLWLLISSSPAAFCLNAPITLTPEEIMAKAVARAQCVNSGGRAADYSYTKRVVVEDLDNQGRITETKEKLFRFRSGLGSLEQIKINGQIACATRLKKEEDRLAGQGPNLIDAKTARRDDHWEKYMTPELAANYQFTLRGRKSLNGRSTYVLAFRPRSPGMPVRQIADHLLNQLTGTVWIDEQDFEIARAEISAQSKVTLGGVLDLLGSLKNFSYVLERTRLDDGA